MSYVQAWSRIRQLYHTQFTQDAPLTPKEIECICQHIERVAILAMALRRIADRLEQEAEETTDRFHTWLTD